MAATGKDEAGPGTSAANCPAASFRCTTCDMLFSSEAYRDRHVRYKHHHPGGPHTCSDCGYSTAHVSALRIHRRTHTGERPFACTRCDRAFADRANLVSHIACAHHKAKTHLCETCGKLFQARRTLRQHRRIHTGEKPFVCAVCQERFTRLISLRQHASTHGAERSSEMLQEKNETVNENVNERVKRKEQASPQRNEDVMDDN
ncbi:gastrula zinc finger protein XlCGF7.1-like [Ornithodoros turicata]|uniref:gastrula zinc finger protein XlCGF7.1-like n=1 Tax=Ornithodoros turicata TaxID=34597 RepID=UPI00313A0178